MSPTLKNALLFIGIGCILILIYLYVFDKKEEPPLVSSTLDSSGGSIAQGTINSSMGEFLPLLLSVRNLQLDDSIFTDPSFLGLKDSSIELVPDGNEGRLNPFAPIGVDIEVNPVPVNTGNSTGATPPTSGTKTGASSTGTPATQ